MASVFWSILYFNLIVQAILVTLLCLPLPSNNIRGFIISALSKLWTKSTYVRYTATLLFAINVMAFIESMRTVGSVGEKLDFKGLESTCREWELKVRLFSNQRNAYISGFSVFLSIVFHRLFVTMKQMHEWRQELKELQKQNKPVALKEEKKEESNSKGTVTDERVEPKGSTLKKND